MYFVNGSHHIEGLTSVFTRIESRSTTNEGPNVILSGRNLPERQSGCFSCSSPQVSVQYYDNLFFCEIEGRSYLNKLSEAKGLVVLLILRKGVTTMTRLTYFFNAARW